MENVFNTVKGFLSGLGSLLMAVIPLTILWQVLTGGVVFGMDVIANLTNLVAAIGEGGFVGLIVLILVVSFFTDKK
jgi:hypothetical protein|tara:strand:+ start:682 stop:909 length:228 start_codon:yes stop_codon:yes gene_type:complete